MDYAFVIKNRYKVKIATRSTKTYYLYTYVKKFKKSSLKGRPKIT